MQLDRRACNSAAALAQALLHPDITWQHLEALYAHPELDQRTLILVYKGFGDSAPMQTLFRGMSQRNQRYFREDGAEWPEPNPREVPAAMTKLLKLLRGWQPGERCPGRWREAKAIWRASQAPDAGQAGSAGPNSPLAFRSPTAW